jgi:hypothetical protein
VEKVSEEGQGVPRAVEPMVVVLMMMRCGEKYKLKIWNS